MTPQQQAKLTEILQSTKVAAFLHGGADGADTEAHAVAELLDLAIVIYPGVDRSGVVRNNRAWTNATLMPEEYFIKRNRKMVDLCDLLIAAVGEPEEQLRSGTWATVRYAGKVGRPMLILYPDGTVRAVN